MIPYGRQDITEDDIAEVVKVLNSDFLTQGTALPIFEKDICEYTGAKFAIGVNSGTSALHLACRAVGLSSGDILWTSAITFASSANCGLFCGASIDFVDIDPLNWNICVSKLKAKLELAEKKKLLPKVLVVVHFCGLPCNLEEIQKLCKKYEIYLIEDAAHALGASYKNQSIGNCKYSDICIFSFHAVKSITTSEGGMAVTNNEMFARKIRLLRSHGITRDVDEMTHEIDGPWFNEQIDLGFNYRMTEIQAVLGSSQLKRLDDYISIRNNIAGIYRKNLHSLPISLQKMDASSHSAVHLFIIRLHLDKIKKSHLEIFNALLEAGIGVNLHYMPVYKHAYFKNMQYMDNHFNESENYYKEAITIPMYPKLTHDDQMYVIEKLEEFLA